MYVWLNSQTLESVLEDEPDIDVAEAIFDALDQIASDPFEQSMKLRGTASKPDRYVQFLPYEYVISFSIFEFGVPPHATPCLKVILFSKGWPGTSVDDG